jgi:hypothetical protein
MTEVPSLSRWIGKILTCLTCHRSYRIEVGDELKQGFTRGGRRSYKMPTRFDLPCGHYYPITDEDYPPPPPY